MFINVLLLLTLLVTVIPAVVDEAKKQINRNQCRIGSKMVCEVIKQLERRQNILNNNTWTTAVRASKSARSDRYSKKKKKIGKSQEFLCQAKSGGVPYLVFCDKKSILTSHFYFHCIYLPERSFENLHLRLANTIKKFSMEMICAERSTPLVFIDSGVKTKPYRDYLEVCCLARIQSTSLNFQLIIFNKKK